MVVSNLRYILAFTVGLVTQLCVEAVLEFVSLSTIGAAANFFFRYLVVWVIVSSIVTACFTVASIIPGTRKHAGRSFVLGGVIVSAFALSNLPFEVHRPYFTTSLGQTLLGVGAVLCGATAGIFAFHRCLHAFEQDQPSRA